MATITITIEDKDGERVTLSSEPSLTRLKENAKANRMMTPAVAYAMVAIAAVMKRHRELEGKPGEIRSGVIPKKPWEILGAN